MCAGRAAWCERECGGVTDPRRGDVCETERRLLLCMLPMFSMRCESVCSTMKWAIFEVRQATFGNMKAYFHCPCLRCFTHDMTLYYTCTMQSRDAKSCVSQARRRNKMRWGYACHCRTFCSGDARFCVSTRLAPSLF